MTALSNFAELDTACSIWKNPERAFFFKKRVEEIIRYRNQQSKTDTFSEYIKEDCGKDADNIIDFLEKKENFKVDGIDTWNCDLDTINQVFHEVDSHSLFIIYQLFAFNINDFDGSLVDDARNLKDNVDMILEDGPLYEYEFGEVEVLREEYIDAALALNKASMQLYDEALKDDAVYNFASGCARFFDGMSITPVDVLENLQYFSALFSSTENCDCELIMIQNKDIFLYNKNRDKFPMETVEKMDKCIKVLDELISCKDYPEGYCYINAFDSIDTHTVLISWPRNAYDMKLYSERDFKLFWKDAIDILNTELHELVREL